MHDFCIWHKRSRTITGERQFSRRKMITLQSIKRKKYFFDSHNFSFLFRSRYRLLIPFYCTIPKLKTCQKCSQPPNSSWFTILIVSSLIWTLNRDQFSGIKHFFLWIYLLWYEFVHLYLTIRKFSMFLSKRKRCGCNALKNTMSI